MSRSKLPVEMKSDLSPAAEEYRVLLTREQDRTTFEWPLPAVTRHCHLDTMSMYLVAASIVHSLQQESLLIFEVLYFRSRVDCFCFRELLLILPVQSFVVSCGLELSVLQHGSSVSFEPFFLLATETSVCVSSC